ncbi:hypothetical protein EYS14_06955 [Alteromonadaceae bacterium M269]|nr:hypothetical protein EYS14_06955 [Alteromonadaceae bacterium M269]
MKLWLVLIGTLLSGMCWAEVNNPFVIDGHIVQPNSRSDIRLPIEKGLEDPATFIPVSIINGSQEGPILAAVAGVHGYEYTSVLAVERWIAQLKPEALSGTVIVVRAAHVPAFENRSIYVNPFDRKNLNRSFPGKAKGTQTERIAWAVSQQVVAKADFLIDLHSGDGAEWLAPFVGVYGGPLSSNYEQALAVAESFNFPNIIRYKMNTQEQVDRRRSLNRQGVAAKIPTILVEIGQHGSTDDEHIKAMMNGLTATLRTLGISKAQTNNAQASSPRYFDGTNSVPVKHSGLWFPKQKVGRFVEKGEILGTLKDYFGNTLETIKSPYSGYAVYGLAGPPVKEGESVMTIATPIASLKN